MPITISFFVLYYAISIAVTRMRAELGTPVHDLHYSGPDEILTRTIGNAKAGAWESGDVLNVLVHQPCLPQPPNAASTGGVQNGGADTHEPTASCVRR